MPLLPSTEGAGDLHEVPHEIHLKRHDRGAFLGHLLPPLSQLVGVGKEPPIPGRRVIVDIPAAVLRDVHPDDPKLPVLEPTVGLCDRALPLTQPFDLGPSEGDPALQLINDLV